MKTCFRRQDDDKVIKILGEIQTPVAKTQAVTHLVTARTIKIELAEGVLELYRSHLGKNIDTKRKQYFYFVSTL